MGPLEGLELSIRRARAADEHGGTDGRRGRSGTEPAIPRSEAGKPACYPSAP